MQLHLFLARGKKELATLALSVIALLLLHLPVAGAAAGPRGKEDPAAIYHNYCSVCHGDRGDGRSRATASLSTPPRDFTTPESAQYLTVERMFDVIRNGRPGTAMSGWKRQLNDDQIRSVAVYVREAFVMPSSSPTVQRGRGVYQKNCATCHGDRGQGGQASGAGAPARDFRSPLAAGELTRERMIAAVKHGKPATAMAGFDGRLSGEDIEAVVDYVRAAIMLPTVAGISGTSAHGGGRGDPASTNMNVPFANNLNGNVAKGRAFYLANCATCHGDTGDGNGPRAYFIRPKPRVLTEPAARLQFNRPTLYAAIAAGRPGTEMPAWDKVLTPQEIADVAEFVYQSFIRPRPPRAGDGK